MVVKPLIGEVSLPGDKSISHRAAMFSCLAAGTSTFSNISDGGDVKSTISVLSSLGANFHLDGTDLEVLGNGLKSLHGEDLVLDCGNSGTSIRLLSGLISGQKIKNVSLVGDESLSRRPQDRVVDPLSQMGVNITCREGKFTPIVISESFPKGIEIELEIASAQVKSAILLAGLYGDETVTVVEKEPTRDHTENMLRAMGVHVDTVFKQGKYFVSLNPPTSELSPLNGVVPGDPSSAAFFGVAAAIIPDSEIILKGILLNEKRTGWISVLESMGADIEIEAKANIFGESVGDIKIRHSKLSAIDVSQHISWLVDELPILSLAMSQANGTSKVSNAKELRVKESDRISVVVDHLKRSGIYAKEYEDGYEIIGSHLQSCEVVPDGDHRIAMTFAISNYLKTGILDRKHSEIVSTSFPRFFDIFDLLTKN